MRALAALAVTLAVAACNAEPTSSTQTTSSESSTAATPQPTTTNTITAEGWGLLHVGMTRAEVTAAVGDTSTPNAATEPGSTCSLYHPANAPDGLFVMLNSDRLTSITLRTNTTLKTDRGFGIGDTAAAIKAAYGASAQSMPHRYVEGGEYITVWTVGAPATATTFVQNPTARGIRYETDAHGIVTSVHAGGDSIQNVEGCS